MKRVFAALVTLLPSVTRSADEFADITALTETACVSCHDADTETRLDFEQLGHDLSDPANFRQWVRIYDRVTAGEMPPRTEAQPDSEQVKRAMMSLRKHLRAASLAAQEARGRVASRRLTPLEYEYTVQDLLSISEELSGLLPAESDSGSFDTIGAAQGMSAVHIRGYLTAADRAVDAAIKLERRPVTYKHEIAYHKLPSVTRWYDIPLDQGGGVIRDLDDAVGLFIDLDYIMRSDFCGYRVRAPGRYRISLEAFALQAKTPVTLKLILASDQRGGAELLGAYDLDPGQTRLVEVETYLRPGDYLYPSVANCEPHAGVYGAGGAKYYKGEGIGVRSLFIDGPLLESWPPASTQNLLEGTALKNKVLGGHTVSLSKTPREHIAEIVERLAPLALRRPPEEGELQSFLELADPAIADGRDFTEALRLPLRSLLSSPQFLFFGGEPGRLDDYALASRLSYFLWKSMPDTELFELAEQGRLSQPEVLAAQVDRMLNDERAARFVSDFLGQWLRLYEIGATSPDEHLYPEFDDLLNSALVKETELFFTELVARNLSAGNFVDSDFTFVNRRLAEHYDLTEPDGTSVRGQHFRRISLPKTSPRGGLLTQASVLKITANGTVTSPVTRGNFVLTTLLGTPPDPPLPNVGSIEPDTRGRTSIRETLDAHRNVEICARCHRDIDPPGFALECFDPIGGFRTHYRATSGQEVAFQAIMRVKVWHNGPRVDAGGTTADGKAFHDIHEFKRLLLDDIDQVARNFTEQLIAYSTGAEVQFADREHVDAILARVRKDDFPVRSIIHEIVQSSLFRHK